MLCRVALQPGDAKQQVFGGDEVILEIGRLFEGVLQSLICGIGKMRLRGAAARHFRELVDLARGFGQCRLRRQANALQQRRNDAFLVLQQGCQYVYRLQFRIAVFRGDVVRLLHGLLCLDG